jgi:3-isopropylmalate dehydratase small subunit
MARTNGLRPEPTRAAGCQVLVAGRNFGCGSSREHAPWALLDFGFRAVISTEIADIFRSNSLKNGLLPIVVDEPTHQWLLANPGVEVEVDLATTKLTLPDGRTATFPIEVFSRYCLMNGIDELGYLLNQAPAIDLYEKRPIRAMKARIAVLAGDGIGPEVTAEGVRVLQAVATRFNHDFEFTDALIGGAAIDSSGSALPPRTIEVCRSSSAVLLGAVGGSQVVGPVRTGQARGWPARTAPDAWCFCQPASGAHVAFDARCIAAETRSHRRCRHHGGAGAPRWHLLRAQESHRP